jgi:ADP-ribosylglycohydrolase
LLAESQNDKRLDRALGSVYGAFIGDALGAYCEFMH